MKTFKPKKKKCHNTECRKEFVQSRPLQVACGIPCAIALTNQANERKRADHAKRERAKTRAAKERLKTRSDHEKDTQKAFNAWVRERDFFDPCISCVRYHEGQYHAGHYRTVGSHPELRFEPLNCHKQCPVCNNHKSGNLIEYRINLEQKVGTELVEWLEGPHEPKKYTIEELRALTKHYRAQTRALAKAREQGLRGSRGDFRESAQG